MSKKDDILQTALHLFAEKGFKDTTMTELSKATGVAEGTIFYHFKSKEDIFLAILENARKDITDEFSPYFGEKSFSNGLEIVKGIISFYLYLSV